MLSETSAEAEWHLEPAAFPSLTGWVEDDHPAAFAAFCLSASRILEATPKTRKIGVDGASLVPPARRALELAAAGGREARAFFESEFSPFLVRPVAADGFFTGYYEPEVLGSRTPTQQFRVPLYARPHDLVDVDDAIRPPGLDPHLRFGRLANGRIEVYPDRAAIEGGFLSGRGLELVWLEDPIDAFFIHIQGSARVRLEDGKVLRLSFAGKSGHRYTPIGGVLVKAGELRPGSVTMDAIRTWLAAHRDEAAGVMQRNRSFIFFKEMKVANPELGPIAAAGVQLTAGRSLAVDRELHTFHLPVWIETNVPGTGGVQPFRRLMVAQDTGSAIVGPARGDIYFGSGINAAAFAGAMQAAGRFVLLVPRAAAAGLVP